MWYVYIIQSTKDSSKYVGFSNDLKKRLKEHNQGSVTFTSKKIPYKIIWYCVFKEKKKALGFEKYLKQGSGFSFAKKRLF